MGWSSQIAMQPGFCQSNREVRGRTRKPDKPGWMVYGITFAFEKTVKYLLCFHLFMNSFIENNKKNRTFYKFLYKNTENFEKEETFVKEESTFLSPITAGQLEYKDEQSTSLLKES